MSSSSLRERIAAKLPKNRMFRAVLALTGGTALAQLIAIGVMPLVTRLYSPADLGIISLFLAFLAFWTTTLSLRYSYALLVAETDEESHLVHRLSIIITMIMSIVGLPVLWALSHFDLFGFGLLPPWTALVAGPVLVGQGVFMVYRSWALRAGLVPAIARASIIRSGANAATRVGLGFVGGGVPGLFAAEFAGATSSMFSLARATRQHFLTSKPVTITRHALTKVARKYSKFPLLESPSAWIDSLALALPLPLVAMLYGPSEAGWFGLARLIVSAPNSQIGAAVADVFQMELAKAVLKRDVTNARHIFYQFLRKMAGLGLLPLVGVVTLCPLLMPWIFGHEWAPAGHAAAAIAPWLYAALIVSPLSRLLSVLQVQEYKLFYDISAISLLGLAYLIATHYTLSFLQFLLLLSAVNIAGYIIYAVLLVWVMNRKLEH